MANQILYISYSTSIFDVTINNLFHACFIDICRKQTYPQCKDKMMEY